MLVSLWLEDDGHSQSGKAAIIWDIRKKSQEAGHSGVVWCIHGHCDRYSGNLLSGEVDYGDGDDNGDKRNGKEGWTS